MVWLKVNAKDILLAVPFILTGFLLMATVYYWHRSSGLTAGDELSSKERVVYHIDDHSDRRNIVQPQPPPAAKKDVGKSKKKSDKNTAQTH